MSSELIGELGQVGLKIGDVGNVGVEDYVGGEEDEGEEEGGGEEDGGSDQKRRRLGSVRPKRFRPAWMLYDIFKDWLRPHPRPELAMCIACNRVIKAGKSELEKHAAGKKHLRRLKETRQVLLHFPQNFKLDESGSSGTDATLSLSREADTEFPEVGNSSMSDPQFTPAAASYHCVPRVPASPPMESSSKAFVTKPAPPWKATAIVNGHVTRLDLSDYKGRYLIMFFYPQDFSKLCASEVNTLSDRIAEFRAMQTEIVACSVDSHLSHLAWSRMARVEGGIGNPKIPLIADPTHTISRDYGVFLPDKGHSLRAHFLIDRQGILRHMCVNDMGLGRGTEELLRLVKAVQYFDETEEGCPADWRPIDE